MARKKARTGILTYPWLISSFSTKGHFDKSSCLCSPFAVFIFSFYFSCNSIFVAGFTMSVLPYLCLATVAVVLAERPKQKDSTGAFLVKIR